VSDSGRSDAWSRALAGAGASLEPLVRPALETLAQARWGDPRSGHWRVVSYPNEATWELAKFLSRDADGNHHYARIQVVATVDPAGQLVTWQVNNGAEFLGLTDLTAYGLQRGVGYLLDQEYREWVTGEPIFREESAGMASIVLRLWRRFADNVLGR
jgi:hypothetical protein